MMTMLDRPGFSRVLANHLAELDPRVASQLRPGLIDTFETPIGQDSVIARKLRQLFPLGMSLNPLSLNFVMMRVPLRALRHMEWEICALAGSTQQGAIDAIEIMADAFHLSNRSADFNARVARVMGDIGRISYSFPFLRFDAMRCGSQPSLFECFGARVTRNQDGNKVFTFDLEGLSDQYFSTERDRSSGEMQWKVNLISSVGTIAFTRDDVVIESPRFGSLSINKVGRNLEGRMMPAARWTLDSCLGSGKSLFNSRVFCSVEAIRSLENLLSLYKHFLQRYREWVFGTVPLTSWLKVSDYVKQIGGGQLSPGFPKWLEFLKWAVSQDFGATLYLFQWSGDPWHLVNLGTIDVPQSGVPLTKECVDALTAWWTYNEIPGSCPAELATLVQKAFGGVGTVVLA